MPIGGNFFARYERVSRKNLQANMTIKKARTIGPRCGHKQKQQGAGIRSSVCKLFKLFIEICSRAANSALGKKSSKKELKEHLQYITLV